MNYLFWLTHSEALAYNTVDFRSRARHSFMSRSRQEVNKARDMILAKDPPLVAHFLHLSLAL